MKECQRSKSNCGIDDDTASIAAQLFHKTTRLNRESTVKHQKN